MFDVFRGLFEDMYVTLITFILCTTRAILLWQGLHAYSLPVKFWASLMWMIPDATIELRFESFCMLECMEF
jgi:hypothetical protein